MRAKLRKDGFVKISVIDTGSGIRKEELNNLGKLSGILKGIDKTTSGFGLFLCNIFCFMIESKEKKKKKGLTAYSHSGKGSCFNFSFKCDIDPEKNYSFDSKPSSFSHSMEKKEIKSSVLIGQEKPILSDSVTEEINNGFHSCQKYFSSTDYDDLFSFRSISTKKKALDNKINPPRFLESKLTRESESSGILTKLKCQCAKVLIVDDTFYNL